MAVMSVTFRLIEERDEIVEVNGHETADEIAAQLELDYPGYTVELLTWDEPPDE
jgi:hypothetical protein